MTMTDSNAVIAMAVKLITKELEIHDIRLPTLKHQQAGDAPKPVSTTHNFMSMPIETPPEASFPRYPEGPSIFKHNNNNHNAILLDASYMTGDNSSSYGLNLLELPPEMFDAFLQADPISPTMNPGFSIY